MQKVQTNLLRFPRPSKAEESAATQAQFVLTFLHTPLFHHHRYHPFALSVSMSRKHLDNFLWWLGTEDLLPVFQAFRAIIAGKPVGHFKLPTSPSHKIRLQRLGCSKPLLAPYATSVASAKHKELRIFLSTLTILAHRANLVCRRQDCQRGVHVVAMLS